MTLYEELKKFSKKKKIASRVYNHEIKESLKIQLTRNRHMREIPSLHFFFLLDPEFLTLLQMINFLAQYRR